MNEDSYPEYVPGSLRWNHGNGQGNSRIQSDPTMMDAVSIAAALTSGTVTSSQLVAFYLERIRRFDSSGPKINSIIAINPTAGDVARQLDAERAAGRLRGPLHGLPIVVKDNYDVVGMPTTGGSVALRDAYPDRNATVVQRMIDAGAIVLAKTNMSELAVSAGKYGYSSAGGLTLNPYNIKRNASGSSSGTAAAVAGRFAAFGLGTDTSGSVRAPASVTGLVGVRSTLGLISRTGVMSHSQSLDVLGPLTNSVRDAAMVLSVMASQASTTHVLEDHSTAHRYLTDLNPRALPGARIGVLTDFFGGNDEVDEAVRGAIEKMQLEGATIVPITVPHYMKELAETVVRPLSDLEFKQDFEAYLASLPDGSVRTLREVIVRSESTEVMASSRPVNPKRIENLHTAERLSADEQAAPRRECIRNELIPRARGDLTQIYQRLDLQALAFPTVSCVASPAGSTPDLTYSCRSQNPFLPTYLASATGFPEVTLPVGSDLQNMPIGMSLLGRPRAEQILLNLAASVECLLPRVELPSAVLDVTN